MNPNERKPPSSGNRNDRSGKQENRDQQNRNEQSPNPGKQGSGANQKEQEREQPNRRVGGDQED